MLIVVPLLHFFPTSVGVTVRPTLATRIKSLILLEAHSAPCAPQLLDRITMITTYCCVDATDNDLRWRHVMSLVHVLECLQGRM